MGKVVVLQFVTLDGVVEDPRVVPVGAGQGHRRA